MRTRLLLALPALALVLAGCFTNQAPEITSSPPADATEDVEYVYTPTVVDPDGPSRHLGLVPANTCPGVQITGGTLRFTAVGPVPIQTCTLAFQVCDAGQPNRCVEQSTTIGVVPVNDGPAITSTPPSPVTFDLETFYTAQATDPDGPGNLTWSKVDGQDTCDTSISAAGQVSLLVPAQPTCEHVIQVCDGGAPNACTVQATTLDIVSV